MARAAKDPATGVTAQQERFAVEYVKTGRPIVAYRRAYNAGGMSGESCSANANKLLNNAEIALRIEHYRKIAEAAAEVTVQRVARELARIGFSDPAELCDDDGNFLPLHMLPVDVRRAVQSVKIVERVGSKDGEVTGERVPERIKEIRFWNKNDALVTMAKWKKMLVDQVEQGAPGDFSHLSDAELEAELKATQEALALIDRASSRKKVKVKVPRGFRPLGA